MKRGLKVRKRVAGLKPLIAVTTVTPMKRGLKVSGHQLIYRGRRRYNRYPDEKGTESTERDAVGVRSSFVTTVTPMKRGLKAGYRALSRELVKELQPLPR